MDGQGSYQQNGYQQGGYDPRQMIPEEYQPISMWGYFGYQILFSIPIIGLIFLIVYSVSAKNRNLKNFARSYFCCLIITLVVLGIIIATVGVAGIASAFGSI